MTLEPQSHDHGPVSGAGGVRVTDLGSDHRLISDGVEQLAHGALICPDCSMPAPISERIGVAARIQCGYCAESAPARDFLVRDVYDTSANEVFLIARIGP